MGLAAARTRMRRAVIPVAAVLALALPSTAGATFREFYTGSVGNGTNNAGVEFHAKFRSKHAFKNGKPPSKVVDFGWFNVPIPGGCYDSSNAPSGLDMRVNGKGRFHGTFSVPNTAGHKATIRGRFKRHNRKAVGTIRIRGTAFSGGCTGSPDTGQLNWVARHGAGE
jgi:hypothetical protein